MQPWCDQVIGSHRNLARIACALAAYWLQVDIVSAGDFVNELHIILAGAATAERGNPIDTLLSADGATSIHGGSLRSLGPGDTCGEMAFFTETPCLEVTHTTESRYHPAFHQTRNPMCSCAPTHILLFTVSVLTEHVKPPPATLVTACSANLSPAVCAHHQCVSCYDCSPSTVQCIGGRLSLQRKNCYG